MHSLMLFDPLRRGFRKLIVKVDIDAAQAIAKNQEGFKKMSAHQWRKIWEKRPEGTRAGSL